jgi:uncharacterized protein (TIGR02001 family)
MTSRSIPLTLATVAALTASTLTHAEFSANMALTSDYVWRGYSQSDEDPAIQGGIDYNHSSGFYVGTWASNVDFGTDMEWDIYAGYSGEAGMVSYDAGLIYYGYPGESDFAWTEGYLNMGFAVNDTMTINAGLAYTNDYFNASEKGIYTSAGLDLSLPAEMGLSVAVGRTNTDDVIEDYTDWKVALSKSLGGFDFELAVTDTNVDDDPLADRRLYFMVSKSL